MIRGLLGGLFQLVLFGSLLVVPAGLVPGGTWCWPRALMFVCAYGVIIETTIVAMAVWAPASLEARLKSSASGRRPAADRVVTAVLFLGILAWFVSFVW
jgi:hypothetical protein